MDKAQNRITVLDVIREIHRQASGLVSLEALCKEDEWRLGGLRGAISVLIEMAEKVNDLEFYALLSEHPPNVYQAITDAVEHRHES